jgi:hypothetical protein
MNDEVRTKQDSGKWEIVQEAIPRVLRRSSEGQESGSDSFARFSGAWKSPESKWQSPQQTITRSSRRHSGCMLPADFWILTNTRGMVIHP